MPNSIGVAGLTVATRDELVAQYTAAFQEIYGADINLGSDTPDGQLLNIVVQSILDLEDLLTQIYNTFDPDNAIGVILDQRVAINGIQRQGGTFTVTPVTVTVDRSVNLYGLDQTDQPIYTVADSAGNKWELIDTALGVLAGPHSLNFRAANPGAQLTTPNTITVPVSIVLGVVSVNNPSTYTTLGVNEESDAVLKVRRQKSVSLSSQGYLAGLLAALENINGVTSAFVYENTTNTTDSDGVPGHSIWVIVSGSGAAADIAQAIYAKRNAGCGMFGAESLAITQVDGTTFTVYWDDTSTRNLFTAFTASSIDGVTAPDIAAIRAGLVTAFTPGVNQEVNINGLATLVQAIDPNCLVTNAGFSLGKTQILTLSGTPASGAFKLNYNGNLTASIAWNDPVSTIQSKLQAVAGLSAALVTGSLASKTLTIDLSALSDIAALAVVTNNTLLTAGSAAIAFSYNEGYATTLKTPSKKNQFIITAADIVILPMILSPVTSTVATAGTETLTGLGGYGSYTYAITVNNSGASINAATGVYTAGSTPNVSDTVTATDAMGNTATATVAVV